MSMTPGHLYGFCVCYLELKDSRDQIDLCLEEKYKLLETDPNNKRKLKKLDDSLKFWEGAEKYAKDVRYDIAYVQLSQAYKSLNRPIIKDIYVHHQSEKLNDGKVLRPAKSFEFHFTLTKRGILLVELVRTFEAIQ